MSASRHVKIEIDGRVVIDDWVDDVELRRMVVNHGQREGYRVHRPTRDVVLSYTEREKDG